jgi:hypothetical protein
MLKRPDNLGTKFFIQKLNKDFETGGSQLLRVYNMTLSQEDETKDREDAMPGLLGRDAKLMFKISHY